MYQIILSEEEIVRALQEHDQAAFSYLYDHYSAALYKTIHHILPEAEEATDTLQKVFVSIWMKIHRYEPSKGRLFTWMLNIARNAAIDTLRSKAYRLQKRYQPFSFHDGIPPSSYRCYMRIDGIGLRKYVARLKPQQRTLIELVYFKGYSHPEIAALQEIPLSTIKTRVRTALSSLRSLLGNENNITVDKYLQA